MERDAGDAVERPIEERDAEGRAGPPDGAPVFPGRGFRSHGTADLAIEIEPRALHGRGHRPLPRQTTRHVAPDFEEPDEGDGRACVEAHDADIEDGPPPAVQRAHRGLLGRGRLLEEAPDGAAFAGAEDAVAGGELGRLE